MIGEAYKFTANLQNAWEDAWSTVEERTWVVTDERGFHRSWNSAPPVISLIAQLGLISAEAAEAMEAVRHGNPASEHIPTYSALEEELADVVIRVMDLAHGLKLDVPGAILTKIEFNAARPELHGKLA